MTIPATPEQIARALGQGKEQPTSGGWKTLCPSHNDTNPSLIIYEEGSADGRPWANCPVCGTNKKLYDDIERATGMHFEARRAAKDFNPSPAKTSNKKKKLKAVYPATIPWHPVHLNSTPPSQHWEYHNAEGELMFVAARYDFHDGKQFRQYSMVVRNGQPVWMGTNQLTLRPLYNLRQVLDTPNAPILVVEGEKAADYARGLPEFSDFVVVAYAAGGKSWKKTDWEPVKNREVWLWPDNDDPGKDAFQQLGRYLWSIASHVYYAHVPPFLPKGWDLADPVPDNWSILSVKWKDAYKPDRSFLLENVTPANYQETFDSMYYVYHDGIKAWTISKQYIDYIQGHPIKIDSPSLMMQINTSHEAYNCARIETSEDHFESAIKVWSASKLQNRQYIADFDFRPDVKTDIIEEGLTWTLNTFTGFVHEPNETGSCDLFKSFLLEVICNGDNEGYAYIWNFLAHMFQFPQEKPHVAIMLNGSKGTGKSFFMGMVSELLGGSGGYGYQAPSSAIFKSAFNGSYVASTLGLFINEWQNTRSTAIENNIKSFITESVVEVQIKYRNNYQASSFTRVFGASNHDHMANITWDERRYSFFNVSESHMQEAEYFEQIHHQLRNGGFGKLMSELLAFQVDRRLIRTPYRNDALNEQKELSKTPAQGLAYKMLIDGEIYFRVLDERREIEKMYQVSNNEWSRGHVLVPGALTKEIIDRYHIPKNGEDYSRKNPAASTQGVLSWLCPPDKVKRLNPTIIHRGENKRVTGFQIPPLEECRQFYARRVGLSYEALFDEKRGEVVQLQPRPVEDPPF